MLKRTYTISMVAGALALAFGLALAAEPAATQQPVKEELYGSQLMTQQERAAHRAKMRAATTPEAKAQIRAAQHDRMKQRARQLGLELPETPPAVGGGMGVVSGECKGMAPCGRSNR
jgi:hypothetical protein